MNLSMLHPEGMSNLIGFVQLNDLIGYNASTRGNVRDIWLQICLNLLIPYPNTQNICGCHRWLRRRTSRPHNLVNIRPHHGCRSNYNSVNVDPIKYVLPLFTLQHILHVYDNSLGFTATRINVTRIWRRSVRCWSKGKENNKGSPDFNSHFYLKWRRRKWMEK